MDKKLFTKTPFVWASAIFCCFLWGSAFPSIKIGYQLFSIEPSDTASIILFAGIRFFLAGVLTLIIFGAIEKKPLLPKKASVPKIAVLSLFQTILQYIFFYVGLAYTTGERASVIQGINVFMAILISSLIFKLEKLNAFKIIGSIIGFMGVIIANINAFKGGVGVSFFGESFIFLSTVSYAFSSVFMKKLSKDDNPAMLSGWQFMVGGAVMIAFGLIAGGKITGFTVKSTLLLIYMAFTSACAYSIWSILLKYNPVSKVTVCGFFIPVFGFVLSSIFAGSGKNAGLFEISALLVVVIGMIIVNKKEKCTE